VKALLTEIQDWNGIHLRFRDTNEISMFTELLDRPDGKFANLIPRRQFCQIYTGSQTPYRVDPDTDLTEIKNRMRATIAALERGA